MVNRFLLAIVLFATAVKYGEACCLFGLSPVGYMPDFCTMVYSAFSNWWWPNSGSSTQLGPARIRHLRFDRASGSWTYNCPCTKCCQYGVDQGDPDTCPQCLLGPGDSCDDWNGECGDGLLCQFNGPMACMGECVWKHEFNARGLADACGEWDGQCTGGLRCKYDERQASLMPLYGRFYHLAGTCVTEKGFHSQGEGQICSDQAGFCSDGLECTTSIFPWLPSTCTPRDKAPDDFFEEETLFFPGACELGLEVALMMEEEDNDDVTLNVDSTLPDEIIFFPGPHQLGLEVAQMMEEEGNDYVTLNTDDAMPEEILFFSGPSEQGVEVVLTGNGDVEDILDDVMPDIIGETDPEADCVEIIVIEGNEPDFVELNTDDDTIRANNTWENSAIEFMMDDVIAQSRPTTDSEELYEIDIVFEMKDPDGHGPANIVEFDFISDDLIPPEVFDGILL